jgi:hypothetical protein
MSSFFHVMFHWPDGGIYSNILASVMVGVALYFWKGRKWLRNMEAHHRKIHELHERMLSDTRDRVQQEPGGPAGPSAEKP